MLSFEGTVRKTLEFKKKSVRLVLSLREVGNFVGINPCLMVQGINPVVLSIIQSSESCRLKKLKEWSIIEKFSLEPYENSLEKFLNGGLKTGKGTGSLVITDYIHDPAIGVLAFKRGPHKHKFLSSVNKISFVNSSELTLLLLNRGKSAPLNEFFKKHKSQLLQLEESPSISTVVDGLQF